MNFPNIHFIREILVADYAGNLIPTMQSSDSNESSADPHYRSAAFYEQADLRTLYHELGGSRQPDQPLGSTVVIPHRTRWASLWKIAPGDVTIINPSGATRDTAASSAARKTRARARDQQMRD